MLWLFVDASVMLLLSEVSTAVASKVVYLLFATIKTKSNVKLDCEPDSPPCPSVAANLKVKVPASAASVLGVIVNTLSTLVTVVPPSEPEITLCDHEIGNPSGSEELNVTVVGVPSAAKSYIAAFPVIPLGDAFCSDDINHQPLKK